MAVLIAEIVLSLFAVFGVYAAARLLVTRIFLPGMFAVTIEVFEEIDPREAKSLYMLAKEQFFLFGTGRVVVLLENGLENFDEISEIFTALGGECYLMEREV
jgi:hypothetical protein